MGSDYIMYTFLIIVTLVLSFIVTLSTQFINDKFAQISIYSMIVYNTILLLIILNK